MGQPAFNRISASLVVVLGGALIIGQAIQVRTSSPTPPEPEIVATQSKPVEAQSAVSNEALDTKSDRLPYERDARRLGSKYAWNVTKTHWSPADEKGYGEFILAIGDAECRSLDACLKSSANIFRHTDPAGVLFAADCADLPYFLRAYYAWKNGLPFSYHSTIAPNGPTGDIRFSDAGNVPVERKTAVRRNLETLVSATAYLRDISQDVSTAMYRIAVTYNKTRNFADHYPVRISRESIRPGTVVYDPKGHVATVYKVEPDGRVWLLQASTNFMVTRTQWGWNYLRAHPDQGAGFKNWRPLRLVGAQRLSDGTLLGGHMVAALNEDLADYSVEQHYGTQPGTEGWSSGQFAHGGEPVDYYGYVRASLAVGVFAYKPGLELRSMIRSLCQDINDRAEAVQLGIHAGLNKRVHPNRLPDNIYGTYGEWEIHSTPSRDARLKVSLKELHDQTGLFFDMHARGDKRLDYDGADLAADLLDAYDEESAACHVTYDNSAGDPITLTFDDVLERLFRLSFDPYHCIERRWGARAGEELATCGDGVLKTKWFEAEQRLRNQIERKYDAFMGYTLEELDDHPPGSGIDDAPDVDTRALIENHLSEGLKMVHHPTGPVAALRDPV